MDYSLDLKFLDVVPLEINNVKEIVLLQQRNDFLDGWSENMLIDGFSKGGLKALGVYHGGINLIAVITYSYCDVDAEIQDLLVDKAYRKKGIATKLLDKFFEILKVQKVQKVFLEVREGNKSAINLYQKNGFTLINTRKKYYNGGENALILQKTL